jgi:hypothetical protein
MNGGLSYWCGLPSPKVSRTPPAPLSVQRWCGRIPCMALVGEDVSTWQGQCRGCREVAEWIKEWMKTWCLAQVGKAPRCHVVVSEAAGKDSTQGGRLGLDKAPCKVVNEDQGFSWSFSSSASFFCSSFSSWSSSFVIYSLPLFFSLFTF